MVRNATYRQDKFIAKIDPEVIKQRIRNYKQAMTTQFNNYAVVRTRLEKLAHNCCDKFNVDVIFWHYYEIYATEINKAKKRFTDNTLKKEARLLYDKYAMHFKESSNMLNALKCITINLYSDIIFTYNNAKYGLDTYSK